MAENLVETGKKRAPPKFASSIMARTLARYFLEEVDKESRKEEVAATAQELGNSQQLVSDRLGSLQGLAGKLQVLLDSTQASPELQSLAKQLSEDLKQTKTDSNLLSERYKSVSEWIEDYPALVGPTLWRQVKHFEREAEILKKEKEVVELECRQLKELARASKDQTILAQMTETIRFLKQLIHHKEDVILEQKRRRLHKKFEMNSKLMAMSRKQTALVATIQKLQGQLARGEGAAREIQSLSEDLEGANFVLSKGTKNDLDDKERLDRFLAQIKGTVPPSPEKLPSKKLLEVEAAYQPAPSDPKKKKVELVTANFKLFFAKKSQKMLDLQKILDNLQDEASIFRLKLVKKEVTAPVDASSSQVALDLAAAEEAQRKERLEQLEQEISRVKSQIMILMDELDSYFEGNLRKFQILDTTARRILDLETRKSSGEQQKVEALIQASGIDPRSFGSLIDTIDFYRQHRQVYFHLHKYISTQTKLHKRTWMRQTIDKRLNRGLGDTKGRVFFNQSSKTNPDEAAFSEEAVVNAFSQNVTEMKRLNGVLNLAIEENNGLYEDNQRLLAKYTAAERALDEERTKALKMEEELLYLQLDASKNESRIAELEAKIRQKKKKIEKLKAAKAKLMEENAELKSKLAENMEKVGVTLVQMAELSQRNMDLQTQFDNQNRNFHAMAEEATLIKARYKDIQQENNVIDKLLRINREKLARKEAELADLQRQLDNTGWMIDKTNRNLRAAGAPGTDLSVRRRSSINPSMMPDPQSLMTAKDTTLRTRSKSPILGMESGLLGTSLPPKRNSAQVGTLIPQITGLAPKPSSVRFLPRNSKDRMKMTTQEILREGQMAAELMAQATPRKPPRKSLEEMLEENDDHFGDIVDADDHDILQKIIAEAHESPQKASGTGSTLVHNSEDLTTKIESQRF